MGTNRVYTARNAVGSLCGPIEAGAPKSRRKTFRNVGSIVRHRFCQRSDFLHLADAARVAAVGLDDVEHFFELYDPPWLGEARRRIRFLRCQGWATRI